MKKRSFSLFLFSLFILTSLTWGLVYYFEMLFFEKWKKMGASSLHPSHFFSIHPLLKKKQGEILPYSFESNFKVSDLWVWLFKIEKDFPHLVIKKLAYQIESKGTRVDLVFTTQDPSSAKQFYLNLEKTPFLDRSKKWGWKVQNGHYFLTFYLR